MNGDKKFPGLKGEMPKSHSAASGCARGPRPLEVESTEMAGDVDDFTDKEKAAHLFAFHCFV